MLTGGQERSPCIEINGSSGLQTALFSANGKHILCGGQNQHHVGVWRVQDGKLLGKLEAEDVLCSAVSKNGCWLAAGTYYGYLFVWDAKSYNRVWKLKHGKDYGEIHGVDFSPDSSRLVVASSDRTATIWSVTIRKQVQILQHKGPVIAAKFSPQGELIATASGETVQIWDSSDGRLLQEIQVKVAPQYNNGLVWFDYHLYVVSGNTIKQLDTSSSIVSEWLVPDSNSFSCIALPSTGDFIAYSTGPTVTLWDLLTHSQIGLIQHHEDVCSIAFSPDDCSLAIGATDGKTNIENLSRTGVSTVSRGVIACLTSLLRSSFQPEFISFPPHFPRTRRSS